MKLVVLLLAIVCAAFAVEASTTFYVDPAAGSDSNPGTSSSPFKTPNKARDTIRAMSSLPDGGVTVVLRSGSYEPATRSSPVLSLEAQDSGTPDAPIVYTKDTSSPSVSVDFRGDITVPASAFKPYKTGSPIMMADLTSVGVTPDDVGMVQAIHSLGTCANARMELFFEGMPGVLARYPNVNATSGYWDWMNIESVVDAASTFKYSGTRPSTWVKTNPAGNPVFMRGYWSFGWADGVSQIASIDTTKQTITSTGPPVYGYKAKARWMVINAFAELDAPNEYFIDAKTATLYFIPPSPLGPTSVSVSYATGPLVNLTNVAYVTVSGINARYTQGLGLLAHNVSHVLLHNIDLAGQAERGMAVSGSNSVVDGAYIRDVGCVGMSAEGGDENTLVRGNLTVKNSVALRFGRWKRTYQPGIGFGGVGHTFLNNTVQDGPHIGMAGSGNDHLFDGNTFQHLAYEVTDSGAWYSGRSWSHRGTILRNNLFSDIRNHVPTFLGAPHVNGIYFDDELSQHTAVNNTFVDCDQAILVGGGRRNVVENNTLIRCQNGFSLDDRGLRWQKSYCQVNGTFQQELEAIHYQQPPYSTHYPHLPTIMQDHPCVPVYNVIQNNQYCEVGKIYPDFTPQQAAGWLSTVGNNTEFTDC